MRVSMPSIVVCGMAALAGCGEITVPVSGKLTDGTMISGKATGKVSGEGTFSVQIPGGITCGGTYNAFDLARQLIVPAVCSDGRQGTAVINRTPDGMSGSAVVTLNDGTIGRVVFGRLTYEQTFPEPLPGKPIR